MSVICKLALRLPATEGVKVMEIEQEAAGARVVPHVFAEIVKSEELAPAIAGLVSDKALPPVLVRLTLCELVVDPTIWLPKLSAVGLRLTAGPVTPVPERATL